MSDPSVLWYKQDNLVKFLAFNATLEEGHQGAATVSKYPIQRGFQVSNHMIRQNKIIAVRAIIPNTLMPKIGTPRTDEDTVGGIQADPSGAVSQWLESKGQVSAVLPPALAAQPKDQQWDGQEQKPEAIDQFVNSPSRIKAALEALQYIQDTGQLCSLSTVLKEYSDLVLISYNSPTNAEYYTAAYFDLVFEQVRVVDEAGDVKSRISPSKPTKDEETAVINQSSQIGKKPTEGSADKQVGDQYP